jgi:hypothetical protein
MCAEARFLSGNDIAVPDVRLEPSTVHQAQRDRFCERRRATPSAVSARAKWHLGSGWSGWLVVNVGRCVADISAPRTQVISVTKDSCHTHGLRDCNGQDCSARCSTSGGFRGCRGLTLQWTDRSPVGTVRCACLVTPRAAQYSGPRIDSSVLHKRADGRRAHVLPAAVHWLCCWEVRISGLESIPRHHTSALSRSPSTRRRETAPARIATPRAVSGHVKWDLCSVVD